MYERFRNKKYILIDPLPLPQNFKKRYDYLDFKFLKFALGNNDKEKVFLLDPLKPSKSSFLKKKKPYNSGRKLEKISVPIKSLKNILKSHISKDAKIGIKIDVEGYELEVIKGLKGTDHKVEWIICESSISLRHDNSHSILLLTKELASQGFYFAGITNASLNKQGIIDMGDFYFQKY